MLTSLTLQQAKRFCLDKNTSKLCLNQVENHQFWKFPCRNGNLRTYISTENKEVSKIKGSPKLKLVCVYVQGVNSCQLTWLRYSSLLQGDLSSIPLGVNQFGGDTEHNINVKGWCDPNQVRSSNDFDCLNTPKLQFLSQQLKKNNLKR